MHRFLLFSSFLLLSAYTRVTAQTDSTLEQMLNKNDKSKPKGEYVMATFKATRIVNSSTVENLGAGILDFRISHRFGPLSEGGSSFFGLDDATTRLGLDYGITNWLMVGLGHNTFNKEDDGFIKVRLLRQKTDNSMPVSVSYFGETSVQTTQAPQLPAGETYYFSNRLYYANQLLIARKFNDWLSLQLMPTFIHYNLVDSAEYNGKASSNNVVSIGVGGRIKITKRIAITGEYYYNVLNIGNPDYHNNLSLGIDIETGGHVFQLIFTNATGMTERTYIGQTQDSWSKGQIHFGFNISRVFTIVRPKEFKDSRNSIY